MTSFFQTLQNETRSAQQSMLQAPVFAACANGDISLEMYQRFLTQAYHHVKHTVPLLMACGARLSDDYEWVRDAIAEYIDEEKGHQEWILNDIHASGGDADAVRANRAQGRVGTPIELMVAYLYHQIDRHNPLALFGMVWVLEGTSVGVGGNIARLVKTQLNLPAEAMTYLTSHSELDQQHIRFFAALMDKITEPSDQQAIIESAKMVFHLYGQMLCELYPSPLGKVA
ncbi:TenA family transcriptional regulator [Vibrio navarrensis]|uniref:Iron-containing redox enzyme family protein n=1 Tax=Vibrio navarrensis TaxID=29495 RepID=A0AAI9G763_9VIBR|nr:iron-containing redox enzyme family protein [Vibrio navarrensis]EJN6826517.1 iron-containing redox enzyme family protein [Vibrio cidicii]EHA1123671.1 iron-containing redox enzyme family protein [Vibrio navarrensis]ELN6931253.1 iron-containing redox enzyme family protein [Vibrio navarrensis]KGK13854.1 long-chain fatty acid--CoA ligase [Vibrio navarrensis]KGK21633.1 long-chain fatty acid--CoA ligase [Vibrio navarrensis]